MGVEAREQLGGRAATDARQGQIEVGAREHDLVALRFRSAPARGRNARTCWKGARARVRKEHTSKGAKPALGEPPRDSPRNASVCSAMIGKTTGSKRVTSATRASRPSSLRTVRTEPSRNDENRLPMTIASRSVPHASSTIPSGPRSIVAKPSAARSPRATWRASLARSALNARARAPSTYAAGSCKSAGSRPARSHAASTSTPSRRPASASVMSARTDETQGARANARAELKRAREDGIVVVTVHVRCRRQNQRSPRNQAAPRGARVALGFAWTSRSILADTHAHYPARNASRGGRNWRRRPRSAARRASPADPRDGSARSHRGRRDCRQLTRVCRQSRIRAHRYARC